VDEPAVDAIERVIRPIDAIIMSQKMTVKVDLAAWMPLLAESRLTALPRDAVLRGRLREGLRPDSAEVVQVLQQWPAQAHFHTDDDGTEVVLVYQLRAEPPESRWVHALLFLATLFTTLGSGALMAGADPFGTRVVDLGVFLLPYPTELDPRRLLLGMSFAFPFLGVLVCHEMGHYWAARRHRVRASLPYFIPFPPYLSVIGSLGAFIRLRGPTVQRSILFDIGASGPIASLIVSLPLFVMGLRASTVVQGPATLATPFVIRFADQPVWLGNGVMTHALTVAFGPGVVGESLILLHPVALAGWLGLFVTALNLLPLGQLDGGHVLYSLFPARHGRLARLFLMGLVPLGVLWWGWWGWVALVLVLHRGRVEHPKVIQPEAEVGRGRTVLGLLLILAFFLTFVPVPIEL
jgi:membrane-associated protease RseP (regulator of RpoE activity)